MFKALRGKATAGTDQSPALPIPEPYRRHEHRISLEDFSPGALAVIDRLHRANHQAYLVGGCVRDLLMGEYPKDFDVATSARPEEVRRLFRRARIIGRRFKLVHVHTGHKREIIEVSTFRGPATAPVNRSRDGRILRDNIFGTIEQDAARRDFTINAFYFDPQHQELLDFADGMNDLESRLVRLIGDPWQRYREDPVRMLRAARFAAKLDFDIEADAATAIDELAPLLEEIPPARLFDESLKLFMGGYGLHAFEQLCHYPLFATLFPGAFKVMEAGIAQDGCDPGELIRLALQSTDRRIAEGLPVTAAFLFAAMYWPMLQKVQESLIETGAPASEAIRQATEKVLAPSLNHINIPRRFTVAMQEIWTLQLSLGNRRRAQRTMSQRRFRAAYDLLVLREQAGAGTQGLGDWWNRYQAASAEQRLAMAAQLGNERTGDKNKSAPRRWREDS